MPRAASAGIEPVELLGRGDHRRPVAGHLRRRHHEVDVVRIIAEAIDAHRRAGVLEVALVNRRRLLVVGERVEVAAEPVVDVARHVHEMAGARHLSAQAVGIGLGTLRPVGRLHRMDVEVDGAGVVGVLGQDPLQGRHDRDALRIGLLAALLPVVPRAQIHDRLGKQGGDLHVVRVCGRRLAHGVRVGAVERRAVGFGASAA